ncbi:hypothetical protein EDD15DRAFT_2147573, partial [Pisolithus albus]
LYTHIGDNRMSGSVCRNIDHFGRLCGGGATEHVRLVTTMCDNGRQENTATYQRRVSQQEGSFWKPFISVGACHERFSSTQKSA